MKRLTGKATAGWFALVLVLAGSRVLVAEPENETGTPDHPPIVLTLDEAILLALRNNFDLALQKLEPESAAADVEDAESVFEPLLTSNASYSESRQPTGSTLGGAVELNRDEFKYDIGIQRKSRTGGTYDVRWASDKLATNSSFASLNPSVTSSLSLTARQPLLRNAWINVNEAAIVIAQNSVEISKEQYEERILEVVTTVENRYWEMAQATEDQKALQASKSVADNLVDEFSKKVTEGVSAPAELSEALADQAITTENIIVQQAILAGARDQLLNAIDPNRVHYHPDDNIISEAPDENGQKISDRSKQETLALQARPAIKLAVKQLENTQIARRVAKNGLLPTLDLLFSTATTGISGNPGNSLDESSALRSTSYSAGLALEIPLGNKAARARHRKSVIEEKKAKIRLDSLRASVVLDVRDATRSVNAAVDRIEQAGLAYTYAQETLTAAKQRLRHGDATSRAVIERNEVVVRAQVRKNRAIIDYHKALARLSQVTGRTLVERNIRID